MKLFFVLFLLFCHTAISAQVDSVVIFNQGYIDSPDTSIYHQIDSFSAGVHVSQLKTDTGWAPLKRTNYTWAPGGLLLDSITEYFTGTIWEYSEATVNQYDAADSILVSYHYSFINSGGVVIDTIIKRLTFNRDTIVHTLEIREELFNGTWSTTSVTSDSFDINGRLTYMLFSNPLPAYEYRYYYLPNDSVEYYLYKPMQGSSSDTDSVVFSYYPNGYRERKTTFNYHSFNGYTPNWMISYTYDNANNILSLCNHLWIAPDWECFTDTISYTYNSSNQLIRRQSYYCGIGGGSDYSYYYNTNGNIDSVFWSGWGSMGSSNSQFWTYDYISLITSIDERINFPFTIYPNPVSDEINIESANNINSIEIIDFSGKKLFAISNLSNYRASINTSTYKSGIYVIIITEKSGSIDFKKFIVVH